MAELYNAFARFIADWAKGTHQKRGRVGTEWRFTQPPNADETESLVPDVSYLATYFDLPKAERTYSTVPPDITVEILSPDNDLAALVGRRKFLRWWGVKLGLIADPVKRTVEASEPPDIITQYGETDVLTAHAFPALALPLREIFAELDEPDERAEEANVATLARHERQTGALLSPGPACDSATRSDEMFVSARIYRALIVRR